jgi:hypothetical protein
MPHSHTHLLTYIIFSTKDRRPMIAPDISAELHAYIGGVVR